jgi:hypothetical protein
MAEIPSPCPNLPSARILNSRGSIFRRTLRRRWFGRSELAALSLVAGILLLMGGVLAGFAAANPNGIALPQGEEQEDETRLATNCSMVRADSRTCEDKWELAMAGGDLGSWGGEQDWESEHCEKWSRVCAEAADRARRRGAAGLVPAVEPSAEFWHHEVLCGNDERLY